MKKMTGRGNILTAAAGSFSKRSYPECLETRRMMKCLSSPYFLLFFFVLCINARSAAQNPIVTENQLAGNPASQWDISGAGDLSIQGFATDISINRGQTIRFKINTDASSYTIDIYRMGYYGGMGARKVGTGVITASLPQSQPNPITNASTGLIDCGNWAESAHWDVPATAVSGIYFAKLTRSSGGASHIFFIVRDDASHSDLLFKTSDGTWQAYNAYGGNSLYVGNTSYPGGHAAKVSYNRPFITRNGGGGGTAAEDWIFNAEYPMVRWLERNGYDVSYFSNVDADRNGSLITNHKIFLSVGHDEYWSGNQRNNVTNARNAGVHLAFFSGNEVYWKTRYENSVDGTSTPYRTLVCYKEGSMGENSCGGKCDPLANVWTGLWRDGCGFPQADGCKPENALTGEISWIESTNAITIPARFKNYRFWRNTSVATLGTNQTATTSNGVMGYEWDPDQDNGSYPVGRVTLSSTTVGSNMHFLSLYRYNNGAMVFGAGTVQWSWGLDGTHDRGSSTQDAKMQQATINLFADMGALPGSIQSGMVAAGSNDNQPPASIITTPSNGGHITVGAAVTISGTASDAGVVTGMEVSVDGGATWKAATGTTSWTFTWTPATSGTFTIKSRGLDDLGNLETTATATNTIQVSTGSTNCTPPTATLNAAGANCQGTQIALKLTAATGQSPYTVVVNNVNYSGVTVGQVFANISTEQSIWGSSGSPQVPNDNDGQALEVGVKFRANQAGTITGLRFYKGSGNNGTHTGSLWTSAGTKLASAVFSGETASGWQEVRFTTPVNISANTTYVASYFSSAGGYASSNNYFTSSVINGALTALQSGTDGSNGVYRYGAGFPTASFNNSNYWVDVLFKPGSSYTFNLTSLTDATGCNNTSNISTATLNQSDLGTGTGQTWYQDSDGDGFGNPLVSQSACTQPAGYVSNNLDCNDSNAAIGKALVYYRDNDGDGYGNPAVSQNACSQPSGFVLNNTDCNDSDAAINPGAIEICDGKDNNCNGQVDEGFTRQTYYRDSDGDGYGNPSVSVQGCTQPAGYVTNNSDCNDSDAAIHPGAVETCDGKDNNCNGQIDENLPQNTYYRDNDGDGFGNPAITIAACSLPAGYVTNNTDCNDSDVAVHPGAVEICDGKDNNCNGVIDENLATATYYRDSDGDGFGNPAVSVTSCSKPAGYVTNNTDCNDSDATVYPQAPELCDGKDNNCNGTIDENCPVNAEQSIWGNTGTPQTPNDNDGQAIELGLKFRVNVAGMVTGVRFYKGSANTGTHTGSLWTSTGTKLASAVFVNETASGWQEVRFTSPVSITANTTYVVSYLSPGGGYSSTTGFFANAALTNGAITALRNGTDGSNGIYRYGGGFPSSTYQSSNYWVDVLFSPAAVRTQPLITPDITGSLQVLPNPSAGCFTLRGAGTGSVIKVLDENGRTLEVIRGTGQSGYLIGCNYRPGVYFVEVTRGNSRTVLKMIKLIK